MELIEIKVRCTCKCHKYPNIIHMQACCDNGYIKAICTWEIPEKYKVDNEEDIHNK